MPNQTVLAGITLSLLVVIGMLWLAVSSGLIGDVTGWHKDKQDSREYNAGDHSTGDDNQTNHTDDDNRTDDDHDNELVLHARPANTALANQTIVITADADGNGRNITFSATKGACTQVIGSDTTKPYSVTWQPSLGPCGTGTFTLTATESRKSNKTQIAKLSFIVTSSLVTTQIDSQNRAGTTFISTSSDAYPPVVGSSPSQILADVPLGPTTTDGERYDISGTIAGHKVSGGTFNLEYRVVNMPSGAVLATGTLTDPTTTTSQPFSATIPAQPTGYTGDIQLQFRSTQTFSAVGVDSFSVVVNHYGLR